MKVRRFRDADARAVSDLVTRTMRISNTKDYPAEEMEQLAARHTPEDILKKASWTHFYVVEDEDGRIAGCGAIGPYWGKEDESCLFTVFVSPERQGQGVGRAVVEALEKDEFFLRAKRIEVPASITGVGFYRKLGYDYKGGRAEPDGEKLYRLEKVRQGGEGRA